MHKVNNQGWSGEHSHSRFDFPGPDPLGVLKSTRVVVEQSSLVHINDEKLVALADSWLQEDWTTQPASILHDDVHFFDDSQRTVNWVLVLDTLNFCFWGEKGQPRWRVSYKGESLDGYWAEAAALTRAVAEDHPLWDADYLEKLDARTLAEIFRGEATIPLFEQRLQAIQETGRVLRSQFGGQFSQAIERTGYSAPRLALLLAENFPSFRDVGIYRGTEVRFLKRAQICVADLYASFSGESWGRFSDLDQLTIFADYKLPQVLRYTGVLEYEPQLAARVDAQDLIQQGSEAEIEIRAATIWACELLQQYLINHDRPVHAAQIDQHLWSLGQQAQQMQPYHRTRTIFY